MRIPDSRMTNLISNTMRRPSERASQLQMQISSGVRILRPSDDPEGATKAISLRSGLAHIEQFQRTITETRSWVKLEESALGSMQNIIRQARDNALQGANTQAESAREAIAVQIEMQRTSLMNVANTTMGSRFIFSGYQTSTLPFSDVDGTVTYAGDTGKMTVSISQNVTLQLNTSGADICNMAGAADAGKPDLFTTMASLAQAVRDGNSEGIDAGLKELDSHAARVIAFRGNAGLRLQQSELAANRLTQSNEVLNGLLTDTEGTDLTQAIVELKEQENLLQATSYITSTLLQGGLLDYLR